MAKKSKRKKNKSSKSGIANFPRVTLAKSLRIPRAVFDQNAGRECTDAQAASFIGVSHSSGPFKSELSSSIKFGLLEKENGTLKLSGISKQIFRPQNSSEEAEGLQNAITYAPLISDVYKHFRGENLPDVQFFDNSLVANFGVPQDKVSEFREIFLSSLPFVRLIEDHGEKMRIIDVLKQSIDETDKSPRLKKLERGIKRSESDIFFNDAFCISDGRLLCFNL